MGRVTILGASLAGLAAAARLARVGHAVTCVGDPVPDAAVARQLDGPIPFPAPWRDFFTKTGRPAKGALGLHGLDLVEDDGAWPGDRGRQWHLLAQRHGTGVAAAWRDLVDRYDDVWLALRPLGLEAELTPDSVHRAKLLRPRLSVEDEARAVGHPELAARVRAVALAVGTDPGDAPAWLLSRLAVERTFGLWRLVDAEGSPVPGARLVELVAERADAVGVRFVEAGSGAAEAGDADATVVAADPGIAWRRPGLLGPTFVRQLLRRPPLRDPAAGRFHASASSPGGAEPWAQLLTGALAAYAVHERLTGQDIRPTNRALTRH